ncbi:hypothetical protein QVD99_000527 [Batrachochytrium dendrobatidis]|nr:hypothetical protein O5D80_008105 [Batrachochytrium dendrobatidis]KAK5673056.1 hypothetical protein QVD99_000527 [Batrachochytrium dendrobatidis]
MICIEVGQCGIQFGGSLFKRFENENQSKLVPIYPFSNFQQLVLDTERKTWRKRQHDDSDIFQTKYFDMGTSGRGNNWSHGFLEESKLDQILDSFRRLAEASFRYDGCMITHSLAGGTGSGLGSRMALELRDLYPKNYIMSCSFAPFSSGETALQNYNALLTLASLQSSADFIGVFSNDAILNTVTKQLGLDSSRNTPCVSIDTLNYWASQTLAGIMLPISPVSLDPINFCDNSLNRYTGQESNKVVVSDSVKPFSGWDLITRVTPMPSMKLAMFSSSQSIYTASKNIPKHAHTIDSWEDHFTQLHRNMSLQVGHRRNCIGAQLNIRGVQGVEFWKRWPEMQSKWLLKLGLSTPNTCLDVRMSYIYGLDMHSKQRSLDLCYNSDDIVPIVKKVYDQALHMYSQRAYVHWYERYMQSRTDEMFSESFEAVNSILDSYSTLSTNHLL